MKNCQKTGIFEDLHFFNFDEFSKFPKFWLNFSARTVLFAKRIAIFWHPWDPWGHVHMDLDQNTHWTYWLQILSKLCFYRMAVSGNYEIVVFSTEKNTFFDDLDFKSDIGQHFNKSEKSARVAPVTVYIFQMQITPLLWRPQGPQCTVGCPRPLV